MNLKWFKVEVENILTNGKMENFISYYILGLNNLML